MMKKIKPILGRAVRRLKYQFFRRNKGNPLICREVFHEVCILATGEVVCSCNDSEGFRILGNIHENRIYNIFLGKEYRKIRNQILASDQSSLCPSLWWNCPFKSFPAEDFITDEANLFIDKIRLETFSWCNLRCPECKVSEWMEAKKHRRLAHLPMKKIREVLEDTKDTLKDIWLYNFGESFMDRNLLDILRIIRQITPRVFLYTHTNGTIMPNGWLETIVREELLDSISFSIDGASQKTYGRYRVGGKFETAFKNMIDLLSLKKKMGKSKPDIVWQYILFKWNDSDEELLRAQKMAAEYGLTILWIITHTPGKSKKYTFGSEEYQKLQGIKHYSSKLLAKRTDEKFSGKN